MSLYDNAMADIRLRDEIAIAALRSLLLIGGKTEPITEIIQMAYKVADAMMDARQPGVSRILNMHMAMDKEKSKPGESQK